MRQTFTARVWQEEKWYVARCLEVEVASQGETERDALANLADALALYCSPPYPGTLPERHRIDVEVGAVAPPAVS